MQECVGRMSSSLLVGRAQLKEVPRKCLPSNLLPSLPSGDNLHRSGGLDSCHEVRQRDWRGGDCCMHAAIGTQFTLIRVRVEKKTHLNQTVTSHLEMLSRAVYVRSSCSSSHSCDGASRSRRSEMSGGEEAIRLLFAPRLLQHLLKIARLSPLTFSEKAILDGKRETSSIAEWERRKRRRRRRRRRRRMTTLLRRRVRKGHARSSFAEREKMSFHPDKRSCCNAEQLAVLTNSLWLFCPLAKMDGFD